MDFFEKAQGHQLPVKRSATTVILPACAFFAALAQNAAACAVCQGEAGSPMVDGLAWGVIALLGVVLLVLGGFAAFFIFLARRAAKFASSVPEAAPIILETEKA
jgi:hypothetical protein